MRRKKAGSKEERKLKGKYQNNINERKEEKIMKGSTQEEGKKDRERRK